MQIYASFCGQQKELICLKGVERVMKYLVVAAVFAVVPGLAAAEARIAPTNFERFELWNDCSPVQLLVESLSDNATTIGLARDRIETVTRSRLRAARIYTDETGAYLYVNINVTNSSYNISVQFNKLVTDRTSRESNFAPTWELSGVGTHGQDAGFIVQWLSEYVDRFIDEYLRVNEDAC